MHKEKIILRIDQAKVSLKEKVFYHSSYYDAVFREKDFCLINKDDTYFYEIALHQLGFLAKALARLFTRKQQAQIRHNENKSVEEILMSDPTAKKLTYEDILEYKIKRSFNEHLLRIKGRNYKSHIHIPNEVLGNIIEIFKEKCPGRNASS